MKKLFVLVALLLAVQANAADGKYRFLTCNEIKDNPGRLDFYADLEMLSRPLMNGDIVIRVLALDESIDAVLPSRIQSVADSMDITSLADELGFDIHIKVEDGQIMSAELTPPVPHTPKTPLDCKKVPIPH